LIALLGTLFGRDPAADEVADLTQRLDLLVTDEALHHRCTVLVRYLDGEARSGGGASFAACDASSRQRIVGRLMAIEPRSFWARLSSKLSRQHRDYYVMKQETVPALGWVYRNSASAWRARGYSRWPGVPGDWRDILTRGADYP
jgi:hypothetical protein